MELFVQVQPRARKRRIERLGAGQYKVWVQAPPSKGEANREVIETIAFHFDLPPSCVTIVKGQKSRRKFVRIENSPSKASSA